MSAGVSPPAAHLFGNHDNQARLGHDRQLDDASQSGGDFIPALPVYWRACFYCLVNPLF